MIKVYRYRVKSFNGLLNNQARAVNYVWNFCNDTQKHALKWRKRWPTGFDLNSLTAGSSKELGIHSGTINSVCEQYSKSRKQFKRPYLRYRGNRSLGWVPVKGRDLKRCGDAFRFSGNTFRVFSSRGLPEGKIKDGTCFSQDRRGNWFLNIVIEVSDAEARKPVRGVGIDFGLTNLATLSNGEKIDHPRFYREYEQRLAVAQRARKKRLSANIHAKIANSRADFLHKISTKIVSDFDYIVVGNISASRLAKTNMAKSVLDAGWHSLKQMIAYKSIANGAWYEEVNECFSSQTCSNCGILPHSRPKGIAGLGIREWECSGCGAMHDRDVNAALNILRSGRRAPVVGIPAH